MAEVEFSDVAKVFPDGTRAGSGLTLQAQDGELMFLVGPSALASELMVHFGINAPAAITEEVEELADAVDTRAVHFFDTQTGMAIYDQPDSKEATT